MKYPRWFRRKITLRKAKQHIRDSKKNEDPEERLQRNQLTKLWKLYMRHFPKWISKEWLDEYRV